MNDTKKAIFRILSTDGTLLALLGLNKPFSNPTGSESRANSIIPGANATGKTKTPFISIKIASDSKVGTYLHEEYYQIRIYNSRDKGFEEIRKIAIRVNELLDKKRLTLAEGVNVMVKYESSLAESEDEGIKLNYRELRYQVSSL